jgi:subtilisin-like proprotein convertase family protein
MKALFQSILALVFFAAFANPVLAQNYNMSNSSVTTCSGNFYDSGGAGGAYGNNQTFVFTICPSTPGAQVQVNFTAFALENNFDFLQVFDGNSVAAPSLGTYTGTAGPGLAQATPSNPTGCLTFRFTSDGSVTLAGWAATISCTTPCVTPTATITSTTPAVSGGVIRICQGGTVNLSGTITGGNGGVDTYAWNFGNGNTSTLQNPTATYPTAGSYVISFNGTEGGCANNNSSQVIVQVSTTPTIVTNANPNPICLGQSANLGAAVTMNPFVPNCTPPVSGTTFLPDGSGVSYTTSIPVNCYNSGQTVTSAADIQNICINMEHSYLGDLSIVIICPNGQSMVLKAYPGGGGTYLGCPLDPITGDATAGPGTGRTYCFTPGAATLLVNGATSNCGTPAGPSINAGNYMPVQPFTNLIGCPLNGNWTIQITDNLASDNGYIFNWDLNFTVPPAAGGFTPTIASQGWNANPNLTSTGATTATVTPTTTGSNCYTYSVTDNFGCTYNQIQCVTVNPNTPVNAGPDVTICQGASTTLTATNAATYSWAPGGQTTASISVSPATTTTYTVTGTSAAGCVTTDQVIVTVVPPPTISAGANVAICNGQSTTLTATGGSTYTWSPATGLSSTTGAAVTASPTATTTYTVTGTSAAGCTNTSTVTVTVNPLPTINPGPNQTVCAGTAVTLAATGASTYTWNNGVTQGVPFTPAATQTYTVTGTSAAGCTNTATVTVTVNPIPVINAPDATVCLGGSVTLTATGGSTYTWSPGTYLNTTTGASVISTPAANITYTVTGTSAAGCTSTDAVTVTVSGSAVINAGLDVSICAGQSTTLTATGGATYTWNNGLGAGASHSVSPATTTTYTVIGTDANGCQGTDAVIVTVNPLPIVNAGLDQTVCEGTSVTLTATGASTYSWNNGVTQGVAFTPAVGTVTYTVTGTTAAGCTATDQVVVTVNPLPIVNAGADQTVCAGTAVTLTATGAATYSWNNGVNQGVAFTPAATTTYTVTGTSAQGCIATDQVVVTVNPLPVVNAGVDQTVCAGTAVSLTATGAATYSWNNGVTQGVAFTPAGTNTYTVTGTDANGCINTDQVIVTVNPLPVINAGLDQAICVGASVTLTATGGTTYTWNNGVTQGVAFSPASTATYTVTGTDANGCINTDQVIVTVNPLPAVNAGADFAVCTGGTATLNGTGAVAYTWNNGVTNGVPFTPAATTTYIVTGTDANGCINTDQITVSVLTSAPVNAGPDVAICTGQSTTLTATGAVTYSWDQGLGTGNNFTVSPTGTTTYTVVGTDGNGCIGTDAITVTVNALPTTNAGTDQTVCQGTSVTLTATGAATYSWDNGVTNGVAFTPGVGTVTYTVTGTSAAGCITTDQVVVTVNPLPTTNAGPDQTVCAGTAVTLTATGAASYSWTGGVNQGVPFTPAATTTYTVTGTSAAGCTTTDQVTITVNPLPTTNAGPDQTVCDGTAITLTATGAATYSWDNGVTNGIAFTPTIGTVTYTVTGTSAAGCITSDQVVVSVNPNPNPVIQGPTEYCTGFTATLSTSVPYTTYNWSTGATTATINATIANNPISVTVSNGFGCTATSAIFTVTENAIITANFTETICQGGSVLIHGVLQSVAGVYSQTFVSASGCDSVSNVTLVVNPLPAVNAGIDQAVCTGTSTLLNATGAINYVWDNGITQGTPFTQAIGTVTYTVTGTDANGCVNTDQVNITVNPLPIVDAGADQQVCIGGTVTLNGAGAATYTWNNGVTNGVAFAPSVTTTYTVTGTDANGCINSDQMIVTVNPLPAVNAGTDVTTCAGGTVTLTGSGAVNYNWNNGITNGVAFTPAATTTYTLTGTDANGCVNTDQVLVTVAGLPAVNAGPDQTVCVGTSVTLSGSGAATYTWDNGVTNSVPFTPAVGTVTYTVTGTDGGGCVNTDQVVVTVNPLPIVNAGVDQTVCIGTSVTLNGAGANTYTWNNGVTNGVAFTPSITNTYTVTGTDGNGCINTDQVIVTVNALPNVNAGPDLTTCAGGSVTLSGSGATSYSWNNGVVNGVAFIPAATNTYTVTGTDANGCINTDQVVVTVAGLPAVNAGPDQTVCSGTSVTLSGSGAATYTWNNGVTNGTSFTPAVGTVIYTVTGTDAGGCVNTDQVSVTVNPLPIVDAGPDQAICIGATVTLSGAGATTYTWNNGVINNTPFTPALTTTYSVTGTDVNGCINIDQVVVTVNPLPNVGAGPDQTVCVGTPVTLSGTGATVYSWNNGVTNAVAFTPAVGSITYTVTGTDGNGCTNTDQVIVNVNALPVINAGTDQTVCQGTQVTLTATGASTYTWDPVITNGTAFTPSVGTTTYTVTGTDVNGCINTDQVDVTVNPTPVVGAGTDLVICIGESVTLNGSGAATYSWNNGVTNGVAFTPSVGTVTYTVTGTSAFGCTATDEVIVVVNPLPNVFAGNDLTICEGQTVTLTGSGAVNYTWDNNVLNGTAFTPSLGTTTYTVTGTSAAGCINTDQVDVTVNPNPIVSFVPGATNGCTPFVTTLTNTTPDSQNCVWTISNGTVLTGCETVPVTFSQGGCYDVTLTTTSILGCTASFTANNLVCVEDYPIASFTPSSNELSTLNTEVYFDNTTTGASTYSWTFGVDDDGSTVENPIYTFPNDVTGQYEVILIATSPLGCTDTATTIIQVYEELLFYVPNTFTPDIDIHNPVFLPIFTSGFDPYNYNLMIFNRWGEVIFESNDPEVGWNGSYGNNGEIEMVQDGVYTWKIEFKVTRNDERKRVVGHVNLIR